MMMLLLWIIIVVVFFVHGDAPTHHVCLSITESSHPHLVFMLPITAWLWKKQGYHPNILWIANSQHPHQHHLLAKQLARQIGADILESRAQLPGLGGFMAQLGRLVVAACHNRSHDWLVISDADVWMFNASKIIQKPPEENVMHYFAPLGSNSEALWKEHRLELQMCHLMGTARTWKQILQVPNCSNTTSVLNKIIMNEIKQGTMTWRMDQVYITNKLQAWQRRTKKRLQIHETHNVTHSKLVRMEDASIHLSTSLTIDQYLQLLLSSTLFNETEMQQLRDYATSFSNLN